MKLFFLSSFAVSLFPMVIQGMEMRPVEISANDKKLLSAVVQGNLQKVKEALAEGADANARDSNGDTALLHAIWRKPSENYPEEHLAIVDELINAGADVNSSDKKDNRSPLCWAIYYNRQDSVRKLLYAGVLTHGALSLSVQLGHDAISRELIMNGASLSELLAADVLSNETKLKKIKGLFLPWMWLILSGEGFSHSMTTEWDEIFLYAVGQRIPNSMTIYFNHTISDDTLLRALGYALRSGASVIFEMLVTQIKKKQLLTSEKLIGFLSVANRIYKALSQLASTEIIAEKMVCYKRIIETMHYELFLLSIAKMRHDHSSSSFFDYLTPQLIEKLYLFSRPGDLRS